MDTQQFLARVLPVSGDYYVASSEKKYLRQNAVSTQDALGEEIKSRILDKKNVYVGLGSFKPDSSRKAQDCTAKRCFYIDIDAGETKLYKTKNQIIKHLKQWLVETKFLPPSMIVDSGNGVHCYWALSEDVSVHVWQIVADVFKTMLNNSKLEVDSSVTADAARILRVPGSINYKHTPMACKVVLDTQKVYSLDQFKAALPKPDTGDMAPVNVVGLFQGASADDLQDARAARAPKYFREVVKECPSMRQQLETHGENSDYNLWFLTLQFLTFCEDGDDYVHRVSYKHASYNDAEVSRKWEALKADKDAGRLHGSATCDTLSEHCADCKQCPHWGDADRNVSWRSPIFFGKAPPKVDELPFPYRRTSSGVGKDLQDDDGNVLDILEVLSLNLVSLELSAMAETTMATLTIKKHGVLERVTFDVALLMEKSYGRLAALFGSHGHVLYQYEIKELGPLLVAWYKKIQQVRANATTSLPSSVDQFGWVEHRDKMGFGLGDTIYLDDGTEAYMTPPDKSYAANIKPKGTEARWRELVEWALEAEHIETEVILATAFAAPLVRFTGVSGCMVSAVSQESGTGKTLALRLAQSVWGDPVKLSHSLSDTHNSVVKKLGISNNLPNYWDEIRITKQTTKSFADFLFQIGQGRDKQRLDVSAELRTTNSWCTMITCASNYHLAEVISMADNHSDAGSRRLLEFEVTPLDASKMHSPLAFGDLVDNYGHIGPQYAQFLVRNQAKIQTYMQTLTQALQKELKAEAKDRFLVATVATLVAGSVLAKKAGYIDFNTKGIKDFLIDQCTQTKAIEKLAVTDSIYTPLGAMASFLNSNIRHTLVTDKWGAKKGETPPMVLIEAADPQVFIRRVASSDPNKRAIYLRLYDMRTWARDNEVPFRYVIDDFIQRGCKEGRFCLAQGLGNAVNVSTGGRVLYIPYNKETSNLFD